MALNTNPRLGDGGTGMHGRGNNSAAKMIQELQGLTVKVLAGAGANTNIAVSGIKTTDTILSCIEYVAGVPTDRTGTTSITSAGNIQVSVATTGNQLVLMYYVKP